MLIALVGLIASAYSAALILYQFITKMTLQYIGLYATPLPILSSAIIILNVVGLTEAKKEFNIYENTFYDIIGIMMFFFLIGKPNPIEDPGITGLQ